MPTLNKLLAFDAATSACSVALAVGNKLYTRHQIAPRLHAQLLLPMIDDLLSEAKLAMADLDCIACTNGPGSFTGVRIACSMLQAFGYALGLPLVLVSTLRAIAQGYYREQHIEKITVTLKATSYEDYYSSFILGENNLMRSFGSEMIVERASIQIPPGFAVVSELNTVAAQDIVSIALAEYLGGRGIMADKVEPIYLKDQMFKKF